MNEFYNERDFYKLSVRIAQNFRPNLKVHIDDSGDRWMGYGHKVTPRDRFLEDGQIYDYTVTGKKILLTHCQQLLYKDILDLDKQLMKKKTYREMSNYDKDEAIFYIMQERIINKRKKYKKKTD